MADTAKVCEALRVLDEDILRTEEDWIQYRSVQTGTEGNPRYCILAAILEAATRVAGHVGSRNILYVEMIRILAEARRTFR